MTGELTPAQFDLITWLKRGGWVYRHWTDPRWRRADGRGAIEKSVTDTLIKNGYVVDVPELFDMAYHHLVLTEKGKRLS